MKDEFTAAPRRGTIVCYGDSNTYGYAPTYLYESRYPEDVIWTNRVAGGLPYRVLNYGVCGREIPHTDRPIRQVCHLLRGWSGEPRPVRLWIMLGTNDLLKHAHFTAEDVAARMETLLHGLCGETCVKDGTVRIRVIAPPRMRSGEWTIGDEERLLRESACLGEAYRSACSSVPHIAFTDATRWDIPLVYDGVHFSEEGHRLFAERILTEVL